MKKTKSSSCLTPIWAHNTDNGIEILSYTTCNFQVNYSLSLTRFRCFFLFSFFRLFSTYFSFISLFCSKKPCAVTVVNLAQTNTCLKCEIGFSNSMAKKWSWLWNENQCVCAGSCFSNGIGCRYVCICMSDTLIECNGKLKIELNAIIQFESEHFVDTVALETPMRYWLHLSLFQNHMYTIHTENFSY